MSENTPHPLEAFEFGIRRGIADFEAGRKRQPMPAANDMSPTALRWYGYGIGWFRAWRRRKETMDALGIEDDAS